MPGVHLRREPAAVPHGRTLAAALAIGFSSLADGAILQDGAARPAYLTVVSERQASGTSGPPWQRTEYIQRDRRREESEIFGDVSVSITRCDRDRQIMLSMNRRKYSIAGLTELRRTAGPIPGPALPDQPTLAVEITTLDTGDRAERFGYTARRVVVTRTETALPGSRSSNAEVRSEGWYIDLNPPLGCPSRFDQPPAWDQLLNGTTMTGVLVDRMAVRTSGPRETGFPIEEHRTYRRELVDAAGQRSEDRSSWSMRVLELSSAPHDETLFEVPAGFQPIDQRPVSQASFRAQLWNLGAWLWGLVVRQH